MAYHHRNAGKPWSRTQLADLAKLIILKRSYGMMAEHLGRSEGAIKAMIDGNSGARTHNILKAELSKLLGARMKGLTPAQLKDLKPPSALDSVDYVEDKMPLGSWPFPTSAASWPSVVVPAKPPAPPVAPAKPANYRKPWTPEADKILREYFVNNKTPSLMASRLNRTLSGVLGRLAHLGFIFFDRDENAFFVKPKVYHRF